MDLITREHFDPKRDRAISVSEWRYTLRLETTLSMKAKDFFEAVRHGDADDFLQETDLRLGEVIEIDDGLKPYCFYFLNWSMAVPIYSFGHSKVKKNEFI